jgi:hypothetical protein
VTEVQAERTRGRARRLPAFVAAALVVVTVGAALLLALRPFDVTLDFASGRDKPLFVSATCDAAATTAWNRDSKGKVALWAVTVGTNMMGYTPVFGKT